MKWFICPHCKKRITERGEHIVGYARGGTFYSCKKKSKHLNS